MKKESERFLDTISLLQDKAEPLLLQLPPAFKAENIRDLRDFLESLRKGYRFVVEVRNRKILSDELYSILRDKGASLALVDRPFLPKTEEVTADFVYIRWEGDRRNVNGTFGRTEVDRTSDIYKWADKIKTFMDRSIEIFGYFSKYYSGYPPNDVEQLLRYLQL